MEQESKKEEVESEVAIKEMYDEVQARIEADALFAAKLQEEDREEYTIEERARFLKVTIAAQSRFKAEQIGAEIRSRPPTKSQLRNLMMTYLKNMVGYKHYQLKSKSFEEIQVLYENHKKSIQDFVPIGYEEDERQVQMMNDQGTKSSKEKKLDTVKVEPKVEEVPKKRKGGHIKTIARKKPRSLKDVDSDDEHMRCLKIIDADNTIDSEVMETKSLIAELHKVSSPEGDYLVVYKTNGSFRAFNYLMEEDLKIMMESSIEGNEQSDFWIDQQTWEIVTWKLYKACGVYILELKDRAVIHMLVERRYPLSKDLLQRMLDIGLEV
ncbi:hypothetical protein Tco_1571687, partial [Tanacetum coccineum]